jgi:signal peptidase II
MSEQAAPSRRKWIVFAVIAVLSIVADQATKIWARGLPTDGHGHGPLGACIIPDDIVARLCGGHGVKVIDGFWEWRLSMNPGSAFGLLGGLGPDITRWLFTIVGLAAVGGMLYMLRNARTDQWILHWALGLVAGGAVGNLIDRVYYGVVTDFILWRYRTHEWPVFNIADVVLVVGVIMMFIDIQIENKKHPKPKLTSAQRDEAARKAGLVK